MSASSVVTSAALPSESRERSVSGTSSSAERGSLVLTREAREELVRALTPGFRQLVDSALERTIAPLIEKQRELEAALRDLRAQQSRSSPEPSPARAVDVATPPRISQVEARAAAACTSATQAHVPAVSVPSTDDAAPTRSRDASPVSVATPADYAAAASTRAQVLPVPDHHGSTVADIPLELDGSRRKRTIAWLIVAFVLMGILCAAGLSVLSNMGIRI
ncbi:MAG: hypothetical protein JW940_30930 [Polyangiaceae bacterium]|nr:hypothetical protein [Polyangiaceae bacterium]